MQNNSSASEESFQVPTRPVEREIQKRIRLLRKSRGLSLRQLAEKVGCTHSYISQIEKGITVPSLSMVGKLSAALDVSVVGLFNEQRSHSEQDWILREKSRRTINYPDGKIASQLLVSKISNRKIEPLLTVIQPGGSSDEAEEMVHPFGTEEFILVIKGELHFQINGEEIRLGEGDTLSFDGALPHIWLNRGKKRAEVLFIFSPPIWLKARAARDVFHDSER